MSGEIAYDLVLMFGCYAYILFMILVSAKLPLTRKASRKFLHAMIGNLPFVIPFFTSAIYPVIVALPFIPLTFVASPYSPFRRLSKRMEGLTGISEEGDPLGLVFYAVSYAVLALLFASKPYIIAAGILPLAYGDSVAALVGMRYGKRRYTIAAPKSLEGSTAMLLVSILSLSASSLFFSTLYPIDLLRELVAVILAAAAGTVIEAVTPLGFDNLTVPLACVATFLLAGGGI